MSLLLLLPLLLLLTTGACAWPWATTVEDDCEFSKQDIYMCTYRYADVNHDNTLDEAEMQAIIDRAPFVLRLFINHVMGGVRKIAKNCGDPSNGRTEVTRESYFAREGCMKKCADRTRAVDHYCKAAAQERGEDFLEIIGHARRRQPLEPEM